MHLLEWMTIQQTKVDAEMIIFDYSVRPEEALGDNIVIAGGFSPWHEDDEESPIIIEFVISKDPDLIEDEYGEFEYLEAELKIVMRHELIHHEQWLKGKFKFDEDDQIINRDELEEEAYALERTEGYIL